MTGACPNIKWWSFAPIFLKIKKTSFFFFFFFLGGGGGYQLEQWGGAHLMVEGLVQIISEARGEFALFIEA